MELAPEDLERVAIIGTSGSGKTSLATELATALGSPRIELDRLFWSPGWVSADATEFARTVGERVEAPRWVCDGNYSAVREQIWNRATAIVWLDYPFRIVFSRLLRSTLRRWLLSEPVCNGNYETLRQSFFSSESVLLWAIQSHPRHKREYRLLLDGDYAHLRLFDLRTPAQTRSFVEDVRSLGV